MALRLKNMDQYYFDTKEFFTNVDIKGTYYQRAKTVVSFLKRGDPSNGSRYFCISKHPSVIYTWLLHIDGHSIAEFRNNETDFIIGKQLRLKPVDDFRRKVILAVDSAETKNNLNEKRERFREVFEENINLCIFKEHFSWFFSHDDHSGVYFIYSLDFFFREKRNGTVYIAWILI